MPAEKRKSAFLRATQEAQQNRNTVEPLDSDRSSDTASQQGSTTVSSSDTVTQRGSETVEQHNRYTEKITFYLTPEQADKLDDLAHAYKKRHRKRINRNDIVRHLIDTCTVEALDSLKLS